MTTNWLFECIWNLRLKTRSLHRNCDICSSRSSKRLLSAVYVWMRRPLTTSLVWMTASIYSVEAVFGSTFLLSLTNANFQYRVHAALRTRVKEGKEACEHCFKCLVQQNLTDSLAAVSVTLVHQIGVSETVYAIFNELQVTKFSVPVNCRVCVLASVRAVFGPF